MSDFVPALDEKADDDRPREEWLAARLELLEAEKELTRRTDVLAGERRV